jgi:hypothetical protein
LQALPLLKAAYDRGLNTWDTANIYSNGVSEEIIRKAIQKYDIPRHKLVILTKCYAPISEVVSERVGDTGGLHAHSKDYVNQHGKFTSIQSAIRRREEVHSNCGLQDCHAKPSSMPLRPRSSVSGRTTSTSSRSTATTKTLPSKRLWRL